MKKQYGFVLIKNELHKNEVKLYNRDFKREGIHITNRN